MTVVDGHGNGHGSSSTKAVDVDDPRGLVEQLLESTRHHQIPEPAPSRALRVLENAAHVDAIITVSAGLSRIGTQSLSEAQIATDALRPLASVVRSALIDFSASTGSTARGSIPAASAAK